MDTLSHARKAERAARSEIVAAEDACWKATLGNHREELRSLLLSRAHNGVGDGALAAIGRGLPEAVYAALYPHQRDGVRFLRDSHFCASGCVLADDMGLGKTVQISAFLRLAVHSLGVSKVLLVAPTSVLDAWRSTLAGEFGGFAPKAVVSYSGAPDRRRKLFEAFRASAHPTVLLSTIGVLSSDMDFLDKYRFDYAILDEAHVIRNATTVAHKAACRVVARHRIAVTGTPVMNSVMDMWALMQFVDPAAIGLTRQECVQLSECVNRSNERDSSEADRAAAADMLRAAMARVDPLVLRRSKRDADRCFAATKQQPSADPTLQTPQRGTSLAPPTAVSTGRRSHRVVKATKHEIVLWLEPTPEQLELYTAYLATDEVAAALSSSKQSSALMLLVNLKKICDHPWLNLTKPNLDRAIRRPFGVPEGDLSVFGNALSSCKVTTTAALCRAHAQQRHKTVVFSASKTMLEIIALVLTTSAPKLSVVFLTGDVPVSERQKVIDRFNSDPTIAVCCVTTGVGGVGVTLTGASRVVIVDPSWNPAVDAQAVDRVHRIGQATDVVIFRLITAGTVEEKIYRRQIAKTLLAKQTSSGSDRTHADSKALRYFTRGQLRELFTFDPSQVRHSETAALVQRLHGATLHPDLYRYAAEGAVVDASDHLSLFGDVVVDAAVLEEFLNSATPAAPPARRGRRGVGAPSSAIRADDTQRDAFGEWLTAEPASFNSPPQAPRAGARASVAVGQAARGKVPTARATMEDEAEEVYRPSVAPRPSCFVARRTVALFQAPSDDFDAETVAEAQRAFGADVVADDDALDERDGIDVGDDDGSDVDIDAWRQGGSTGEERVWPAPRDTLSSSSSAANTSVSFSSHGGGGGGPRLSTIEPIRRPSGGGSEKWPALNIDTSEAYSMPASGRASLSVPVSPVRVSTAASAGGQASYRPTGERCRDSLQRPPRQPLGFMPQSAAADSFHTGKRSSTGPTGYDDEY